jgi:hypothetical protein
VREEKRGEERRGEEKREEKRGEKRRGEERRDKRKGKREWEYLIIFYVAGTVQENCVLEMYVIGKF